MVLPISQDNMVAANMEGSWPVDLVRLIISDVDSDGNYNPDGTLRFSTLYQNVVIALDDRDKVSTLGTGLATPTYTSAGHLLSVSRVDETLEAKQNSIRVALDGIQSSLLANPIIPLIENNPVLGSRLAIYRGYWDEYEGQFFDTPYLRWEGVVNKYSTNASHGPEGDIVVQIEARNLVSALLETINGRYTSEESFARLNPEDRSMEFVPGLWTWNPRFGVEK